MRVSEVSESTRQHTCVDATHCIIAQVLHSAHTTHTQRTRSAHAAHTQRTRSARERWVGGHRTSEAFLQGGPLSVCVSGLRFGWGVRNGRLHGRLLSTHSPADSPTHHPLSWSNRVDGTTQRRPRRGRQHRFQRRVPRPRRAERRERARRARLVAAPRALRASPLGLTLLGECTGRTQQGSRPPPLAGPPAQVPTLPIARRPFLTPLFSVLSPVTSAPITPQASKVAP